ncbi:MAG: stage sporulation protein [Actinomycetota bacterium]|nr:stage sporulation protein [Actinomycetota bacterium]
MMRRFFPFVAATFVAAALVAPVALAGPAAAGGSNAGNGSALTAGPAPDPGAATRSPGNFTFFGSGWGHGLGMSQWGAYGLSKKNWNHSRILEHFYSGTTVVKEANLPQTIRVGLTSGNATISLHAAGGPVSLRTGDQNTGHLVGKVPGGKTWTVRAVATGYKIVDQNGHTVGGSPVGGPSLDLFATYASGGARVTIPQAGASYDHGYIQFEMTGNPSSRKMKLVLPIKLEDYLLGIGEMPSSWPAQALESQVVAARSYAVYKLRHYPIQSSCDCDVVDGSNDQTYIGWNKSSGPDGARWVHAVGATDSQVVEYQHAVADTFFTASDGGHTEDIQVQWGTPQSSYPYLAGVCDAGESVAPGDPWLNWSKTLSATTVTNALGLGGQLHTVAKFSAGNRGSSGRIETITAYGTNGKSASVSGASIRSRLGLYDDRVWVNSNRNVLGGIRSRYDAANCAPGLPTSQRRSVNGGSSQTFQHGAIYANAKAHVNVWIKGDILNEYHAVGGAGGRLGLPTSKVIVLAKNLSCPNGCSRVDLTHGRIYSKGGVATKALWGKVLQSYLNHGGASGSLGFPTSRVQGSNGTSTASFEHGTITCNSSGCSVS